MAQEESPKEALLTRGLLGLSHANQWEHTMPMNRIQFQRGTSLPEFLRSFGHEHQCAQAVKQARWPDGFRCPRCASAAHYVVGHGARKLFQCCDCRHQSSLTAGSLFESTKLPLTTWFLAP